MTCPPGKACPQLFEASDAILDRCEGDSQDLVHFDVPSIHVEVDPALHQDALEQTQRHSVAGKVDSEEEESESTAL